MPFPAWYGFELPANLYAHQRSRAELREEGWDASLWLGAFGAVARRLRPPRHHTSSGSISASASAGPTAGVVSPEPTNAPSPPDVPTDCGELPIDACRLVVDAAVRLVAPGAELTGVAVTPWHGEQGCGEGKPLPCPSMPPHYVNGAELQLADRRPLALDCYSPATQYLFDPASPESEKAWSSVVVCEAVDEANGRQPAWALRLSGGTRVTQVSGFTRLAGA